MAAHSGEATAVLFCEEDNVHVTQWKIRTTGIKARLDAQQESNSVAASIVGAENNNKGTLGGRVKAAIDTERAAKLARSTHIATI